jgi:hypothetical protein
MASVEDLADHIEARDLSFAEAISRFSVVAASSDPKNPFVVMADRDPGMTKGVAIAELGYASPSPWTAWTRTERVAELRDKQGLRTYYDMKRADGTVRGALRLFKTPIMAARWFVESASDSAIDKNIADFVQKNLFQELSVPWSRIVEDALLMCDFGFFPFELVFETKDNKLKLRKIAPRHPMDVSDWSWDDNGGINGVWMEPGTTGNGFQGSPENTPVWERIFIPIEKMVIFVFEQEAGDLRGISILRSAYKHYYYKDTLYKIDAIQKERHGIGVPIIKLPPGFSSADRSLAEDLGRNLRTNERAHIVIPANWEIMFAKLEGQPVDCMVSIEHHDMKIKSNILAPFMDESNPGSGTGGFDVFYKSTRYVANTICDTFNHFVIPKLVDFNFARGGYPKLRVRRIGEWEDIRTMSFAFRNFVGAGAITPDDQLEHFLRSELDLPAPDHETQRLLNTPQLGAKQGTPPTKGDQAGGNLGAKVGMPRQSTSPPVGPGKSNVGTDSSGGK